MGAVPKTAREEYKECIAEAIHADAAERLQKLEEKAARSGVVLHDDYATVGLTKKRLAEIGEQCMESTRLATRVKAFGNPEIRAKIAAMAPETCEEEAHKLKAKAENHGNETVGYEDGYQPVTAADLADLEETEQDRDYLLQCNAPEPAPKVNPFQKELGAHALSAIREVVEARSKKDPSASIGGVLTVTLEVKKDGRVRVVNLNGGDGFEHNGYRPYITAALNSRLKEKTISSLPVGLNHFIINFNSTAQNHPQTPPIARPAA